MNNKNLENLLKKLLPAEHVSEVVAAIEGMVAEQASRLEAQYNENLKKAYDQVSEEMAEHEAEGYAGYEQALACVMDANLRIENMRNENENHVDKICQEAWEKLEAVEAEKNKLEVEIYNEFNNKLKNMNDFYVEKVDAFLQLQNAEIYEHARRDILNDPRTVEHKVALDKIVETVSSYVSEENVSSVSAHKVEEAFATVQKLREDMRVLEARNVRLSTANNKLNEEVRAAKTQISESTQVNRQERARTAKNVSGRGQRVLGNEQVIAEYNNPQLPKHDDDQNLIESNDVLNDLLVLSGLKQSDY